MAQAHGENGGYIRLKEPAESELVIKRSKFVCGLYPVRSEDESARKLAEVKKRRYNAAHHCSAMILGERRQIQKCSDDGEPQGTAGVPMLEALRHSGATDLLAVVTRYFGGVLLGAGGLTRAYSKSVAKTLALAEYEICAPSVKLHFAVDYADYSKLMSFASAFGAELEAGFGENVTASAEIKRESLSAAEKKLGEMFMGERIYTIGEEGILTRPYKKESGTPPPKI